MPVRVSKERNYVQYTFIKMLFLKHYKVKYSVRNDNDNLFIRITYDNWSLLIRRNSLLVLDLGLDILNAVTWLNLEGDGLAREGLNKNLHFLLI